MIRAVAVLDCHYTIKDEEIQATPISVKVLLNLWIIRITVAKILKILLHASVIFFIFEERTFSANFRYKITTWEKIKTTIKKKIMNSGSDLGNHFLSLLERA